jgi:DMSO reductase anchor subunit
MLLVERIAALLGLLVNAALPTDTTAINVTGSLAVALLGMLIAPLHLGQPLRAWRVFLGLRTSWLSREAVVLGKYVGLLAAATLLYWLPSLRAWIPESVPARVPVAMPAIVLSLAIAVGVIGLCCSAMIYVATQRQLWRSSRTFSRFFGTAVVGGAASTACVLFAADAWAGWVTAMVLAAVGMLSAKLLWEWRMQLAPAQAEDTDEDRRSRRLVSNELRSTRTLRLFAGAAAVALWLLAIAGMIAGAGELTLAVLIAAWLCCLIGEFAERLLYFQSVVHDRMPGTLQ